MITVLQNVHEDCVVVIDYLENISLETWKDWGLSEQPVDRVDPYGDIPVVSRDGITEDKTGIDGEEAGTTGEETLESGEDEVIPE